MRADPYLYFQGRCQEALEFYRTAIGAEILTVVHVSEMPGAASDAGDNVMHAVLKIGDTTVLASDGQGTGSINFQGFSLALSTSNDAETEKLFAALSEGGKVQMPLMSTSFSSRMGMVADRFGTPWMFVTQQQPVSR